MVTSLENFTLENNCLIIHVCSFVSSLYNYCLLVCLQLETLSHVDSMRELKTLNISNCLKISNIQQLQMCSSLKGLSLAGIKLSYEALEILKGEACME